MKNSLENFNNKYKEMKNQSLQLKGRILIQNQNSIKLQQLLKESKINEQEQTNLSSINLIDFVNDINQNELNEEVKNYHEFLRDRIISIQKPELIKEGFLVSYKLYKIKSKKKQQNKYSTLVNRRFNDFQFLHSIIIEHFGGYVIPRLPSKNFFATINLQTKEFQSERVKDLTKYLQTLLNHPQIRYSQYLKNFLFDQQFTFSTLKGEFISTSRNLQNIKAFTEKFLNYGKNMLAKYIAKGQTSVEFNKLSEQQIQFKVFEHEIEELIKTTEQVRQIVLLSEEEYMIIRDIISNTVFQQNKIKNNSIEQFHQLIIQFQQISSFIVNCHDAISRTKQLKQEIIVLENQQNTIKLKENQNPRNPELDSIRNKLQKLKKKYQKWKSSLKTQIISYTYLGKTHMERFVKKLAQLKKSKYNQIADHKK